MGTANLDDVVELELLGVHGVVELLEGGKEGLGDLDDGGDVHGGGEAGASASQLKSRSS